MILDGYRTGLGAAVWTLGVVLGVATAAGPWTLGAWLIYHTWRWASTTRPAWWLKAKRAIRRERRTWFG